MAVIPLTDPGDIKLYILCIMQNVGYPLEYTDINDLALYEGVISNMDFIDAFETLERDGLVKKNDGGEYFVTDDGLFLCETLKSGLAGYISDRGLNAALKSIDFRKSKVRKTIGITALENGKSRLDLALLRQGEEIMSISLVFATRYQAEKAAGAFSEDPELIYTRLITLLGGK